MTRRALHFLVLGGLIFIGRSSLCPDGSQGAGWASQPRIVISAARREQIRRELDRTPGRPSASEEERARLADEERARLARDVDEEILYREALVRGLDRDDPVVRERVIQGMRLLSDDPHADEAGLYRAGLDLGLDRRDLVVRRHLAAAMRLFIVAPARLPALSDAELREVLARDPDRYRLPATTSITHVFLSGENDRRFEERAARLLDRLRLEQVDPAAAPARGDPFPLGFRLRERTAADLDAVFGAGFGAAVAALPVEDWGGPIVSSYGLHLVWVHARVPERMPTVEASRRRLVERAYHLRGERRLREWLEAQRLRYEVRLEEPRDQTAATRAVAIPLEDLALPRPAAIIGD
jgi:hypothetical protein